MYGKNLPVCHTPKLTLVELPPLPQYIVLLNKHVVLELQDHANDKQAAFLVPPHFQQIWVTWVLWKTIGALGGVWTFSPILLHERIKGHKQLRDDSCRISHAWLHSKHRRTCLSFFKNGITFSTPTVISRCLQGRQYTREALHCRHFKLLEMHLASQIPDWLFRDV